MTAAIVGTFACGSTPAGAGAMQSGVLVIPSGATTAKLTLGDAIGASNTVKTQKSTNNGATWVDQVTYNAAQAATPVAVVPGEHWRLVNVAIQALSQVSYKFSAES